MSTVHIPKIETSENLTIDLAALGDSCALESVHRGYGGWLLVAGAARAGDAEILVNGAAGCA